MSDRQAGSGTAEPSGPVLDAVLASWDRGNEALINMLRAIPEGRLNARAMDGSPTIAQMFAHLHHERMISVAENAPEHAGQVPAEEWNPGAGVDEIAAMLAESGRRVREAVVARSLAGQALERDFAHPVQMLLFLIFHDGYHHGQIKLALKAAGCPLDDAVAGPLVWAVWRAR